MLKFFCKIIKFLYKCNMLKYIINFLIKICLINIFTIKIFSQNCCDECFENCKKILCKKNDNNSALDNNNSDLDNNNSDFDNNLNLNNKNDNSNSNNNPNSNSNSNNNPDLDDNQEKYFESLLDNDNFDNNIRNFDDSIFSENSNSTDAEYTIVKDGTKGKDGIWGKGSYGTVYKVKNKKGKHFALKKNFIPENEESATKKEIQTLIKCRDCKNVIKIVDAYKKDGTEIKDGENVYGFYYYIITELYDHGDLSNISSIDNIKSHNIKKYYIILRRIIYQMINAVKQVHDKGIIHRDIKPDNFFIGENDKLYLGDFGCATENYDGISAGDFKYRCNHLLTYLETKGKGLKQDEKFNKLYKFLDIFALATSIFHFLTGRRFLAQIDYKDFINENITADKKWEQIIYDRFDEKDISGKLSIFRYTSEECEYNENVAFEEWKELEEYIKLEESGIIDIESTFPYFKALVSYYLSLNAVKPTASQAEQALLKLQSTTPNNDKDSLKQNEKVGSFANMALGVILPIAGILAAAYSTKVESRQNGESKQFGALSLFAKSIMPEMFSLFAKAMEYIKK